APAHWARLAGAESGTRFAGADSLWPVPFPPPPPPPVARLCSETSLVLRGRPTSCARSSSAYVLGLPDASRDSVASEHRTSRFSCEVFPYVHGVSDRAGLDCISRYRCIRCCL